ncbi:hypothetical protein [Streptomyces sp. CA2R106]|uniref:hypothetical protein n=1 Tax=Streptomyces sp. CA2R106 TaxID=3120153 RepID=UPI003009F23A
MSTRGTAELDALIGEATVDTYDEVEAVNGFLAVIDEHLAVPFATTVLGVEVTVVEVDLTSDSRLVARCVREGFHQDIGLAELPLPEPPPDGARWVEAYRRWCGVDGVARTGGEARRRTT